MAYEDPDFELFDKWDGNSVVWLRPSEIAQGHSKDKAVFVDNDFVVDDIDQGWLGDCWFLASIASVIDEVPHLLANILAQAKEDFDSGSGKLTFKFFDCDKEVCVVIDDRLPCFADTRRKGVGNLLFCSSNDSVELWSALLEKAFAKFHGGYANLNGGRSSSGISYLTGFIALDRTLKYIDDAEMEACIKKGVSCSAASGSGNENVKSGIVYGHAYAVLGCKKVGGTDLIVLANPWGRTEWDGPWSDNSSEWEDFRNERQTITEQFGLAGESNDGIFCMSFSDFRQHFKRLTFAYDKKYFNELVNMTLDFSSAAKSRLIKKRFSGGRFYNVPEGLPSAVFTKEFDESMLVVQMRKQGPRKEKADIYVAFDLGTGEKQETPWGKFYFTVSLNERVSYQWEQRKVCTGIPAGTYTIFFSTHRGTYKGSLVAQVHEQVAFMPDRKQKNHKFTFDKHPKSTRKYDVTIDSEWSSEDESQVTEDDDGPLDQFIGKTVRISRTWDGKHQAFDAGETDDMAQILWRNADESADSQHWEVFQEDKSENLTYYSIRSAMNTDLSVNCKGAGTNNGTPVIVNNFTGTSNQLILVAGKRGDDEFKLRFGFTAKLIEGGEDGVLIWSDNGGNHQWLKITIVGTASN